MKDELFIFMNLFTDLKNIENILSYSKLKMSTKIEKMW